MKKYLKKIIPPLFYDIKKSLKKKQININEKISKIPRYKPFTTKLFEKDVFVPDSASFLFIYNEVFEKQIYKFTTNNPEPLIIDAGANIGLSVLYFKRLFPNAKIIAFEPDDNIYNFLQKNINSFELKNVELIKKALWKEITELSFFSEGADGGRIDDNNSNTKIQTDLLSNYLKTRIDFLKIDIEGAELIVMEECKHLLQNVDRMFIEYHSFADRKQELSKLLKIIEEAGFRVSISSPGVVSSQPFIKRQSYMGMDFQLNIYCYKN